MDETAQREDRNKHLEFIQSVIARLANNSFLMKGWAITVSGAFFGFAVDRRSWRLAVLGILPVVGFWFLDSYFLWQERLFRRLYNAVRQNDPNVEAFSMNTATFKLGERWAGSFRSVTLVGFYLAILIVGVCIAIAYRNVH
ncbi:MAG: hypothetical protein M3P53_00215 [Actinomycetota bacterium]|nr:hypothetical protein [Actinomycetota bacterium]